MSMNAGIIQVVCFLCLVVLFGFTFKKYPLKPDIKSLVIAALFIIIALVLNALSLMIPFFGVPSLKVSFALLPIMVAGCVLSPSWAYLVGLLFDLLGLLITPTAFPFLGFTLSSVLIALLPSLWYQRSLDLKPKYIYRLMNMSLLLLGIVAIFYLWQVQTVDIEQQLFEVTTTIKVAITLFIAVVITVMLLALSHVRRKMSDAIASELAKWSVVALFCEVLYSLILTPLWLDIMYGIPWWISTFIRVIKICLMVPLNIVIGYTILKAVQRLRG